MYFNMNGTNKGVDYGLVTLEIQSPPLMPVGLNSHGRTLPGRHGVAASPPGSQVFAHMRSLNNNTLPVWVYCLWRAAAMTRWCHHQYARWGSLSPLVRCLMKVGFKDVWEEEDCGTRNMHSSYLWCHSGHQLWTICEEVDLLDLIT